MISISGTLPVNPAAPHITSAAIAVSPVGCRCDEPPGCHPQMANELGFLSEGGITLDPEPQLLHSCSSPTSAAGTDGRTDGRMDGRIQVICKGSEF
ncbi:hypothetical protein VZT92_026432 [Zoarces viviparus]|uniref:Uncharacterized protein n=1 Tax=Zoarces viviparus TaxID=48416 RepID=A0AAW1E0Y3_ZOAVI